MSQMEMCPTTRADGKTTAGFKCATCNTWITQDDWKNWLFTAGVEEIICPCGKQMTDVWGGTIDPHKTTLAVREAQYNTYLSSSSVKTQKWYHATSRKKWLKNISKNTSQNDFYPHVGTLDTVEEFIIQSNMLNIADNKIEWLYEVHITPDAVVKEGFAVDDQVDAPQWGNLMRESGVDIVRYVNRYESPGSVSLITTPSALHTVKRVHIQGFDAQQSSLAEFLTQF